MVRMESVAKSPKIAGIVLLKHCRVLTIADTSSDNPQAVSIVIQRSQRIGEDARKGTCSDDSTSRLRSDMLKIVSEAANLHDIHPFYLSTHASLHKVYCHHG
jgi:hypothetical protein